MKNPKLESVASRILSGLALSVLFGILVVWAEPEYLECSDVDNDSCNTCNDSCGTVSSCLGQLGPCSGYVFDYTGTGSPLSCTLIEKNCGPEFAGQLGTNCRETTYQVNWYYYDNAYTGGCPPCIRSYEHLGTRTIQDVLTQYNPDCIPE